MGFQWEIHWEFDQKSGATSISSSLKEHKASPVGAYWALEMDVKCFHMSWLNRLATGMDNEKRTIEFTIF